ncbi:MAG: GHKL domain-containing protein [Candidatus Hydrogenedens sp.]|nr:GHKL domain-containing protein [Candidatus Hydrogenedens sp.]
MYALFMSLFDTSDFMPRWYCGNWTDLHGWTHVISDLLVWGAYMAIPCVLVYFVSKRRDVPFPRVFWLFGIFIVACGSTHFIEAVIFWEPIYRVSAIAKVITAIVSWLTVFALIRVVPIAMRYPGIETVNIQLRQANQDLEEFARVVSHDLRAPLRGIRRLSEWLDEELTPEQTDARAHIADLQQRVDHMESLIERVLAYSRGPQAADGWVSVDTGEICDDAATRTLTGTRMQYQRHGDFPVITADPTQIYQVFQNLLDNAARHTSGTAGRIDVSVQSSHTEHCFTVRDHGAGMSREDIERLFEPSAESALQNGEEHGIGLQIVQRMVQRHGGLIWAESEGGGGTSFHFTIPRARPAMAAWYNAQGAMNAQIASLEDGQ